MRPFIVICSIFLTACNSDRISKLEKEVRTLSAKIDSQAKTASLSAQKECAAQAEQTFAAGGWKTDQLASYTNHYNPRLGKCFMEIENTDIKNARKDGSNIFMTKSIIDAFERKEYASYMWSSKAEKKYWEVLPIACHVLSSGGQKVDCHSSDEFDNLVKSYMGE